MPVQKAFVVFGSCRCAWQPPFSATLHVGWLPCLWWKDVWWIVCALLGTKTPQLSCLQLITYSYLFKENLYVRGFSLIKWSLWKKKKEKIVTIKFQIWFQIRFFFSPVRCHAIDQADLELAVLLEICVFNIKQYHWRLLVRHILPACSSWLWAVVVLWGVGL